MPTFMKTSRISHAMGEDADDVRRALTIVYRGHEGIPQADVERMFSFDMEWVAPHEAEDVVNALLNAGWLKSENGQLHLAVELGEVAAAPQPRDRARARVVERVAPQRRVRRVGAL